MASYIVSYTVGVFEN